MIFQGGLTLTIANRYVQAVIDFDTGQIGFTAKVDNEYIEYSYLEAPREFKIALVSKLEPHFSNRNVSNSKICRKN